MAELSKLDPDTQTIVLSSGLHVQLESLRARQFFKLLKIITHGAMPNMRELGLNDIDDLSVEEFMGRLLTVVVLSIPDAEDETIGFIRSMCYPAGLIERKGLNKQDVERNKELWAGVDAELENPQLEDLVTIIEAIVKREADDIQALGKRLASMFKLAEKTGQLSTPPTPKASTPPSSEDSPAPSTSWPPNTAGTTPEFSTSPSADSGNAWLPSASVSTTHAGSASNG